MSITPITLRQTWKQLKEELERRGIRDDDVIDWIDIAGGGNLVSGSVWRGCEPTRVNLTINPFKPIEGDTD